MQNAKTCASSHQIMSCSYPKKFERVLKANINSICDYKCFLTKIVKKKYVYLYKMETRASYYFNNNLFVLSLLKHRRVMYEVKRSSVLTLYWERRYS